MIEVKGNGKITSEEKNISSFTHLHISIGGLIELIQADEERVVIEADENLHEYLEVINSGRTLYVTTEGKWRKPVFTALKIRIYYRQLYHVYNTSSSCQLACVGPLNSSEPVEIRLYSDQSSNKLFINAPVIRLHMACVGNVELKGCCQLLEISAKSEGSLFAKEMLSENVALKNYSAGELEIYSGQALKIANYGKGDIHYWGKGVLTDVKQFGQGTIKHNDN